MSGVEPKIKCRACNGSLFSIWDFKDMPLVNAFSDNLAESNKKFGLNLMVCVDCTLAQIAEVPNPDLLFLDYHHQSSASNDNKNHLVHVAEIIENMTHSGANNILEVGCNDGTLLTLLQEYGLQAKGIDPAKNFSELHSLHDLRVLHTHFGDQSEDRILEHTAGKLDAIIGINVFAHFEKVPEALTLAKRLLKDDGFLFIEVAYAKKTLFSGAFDTVYHEHVFNWTLVALTKFFGKIGMRIDFAEEIDTQGGSLRILCRKNTSQVCGADIKTNKLYIDEIKQPVQDLSYFNSARNLIRKTIGSANTVLNNFADKNEPVLLVGAPARGVVFVNSTNLRHYTNLIIVDDSSSKHGSYFPGLANRVHNWEYLNSAQLPSKAVLLSWNYRRTMTKKLKDAGFKGELLRFFPQQMIETIT